MRLAITKGTSSSATTSSTVKIGVMMVSLLYSPICFKSVFIKNSASSQIPLS